MDPSVKTRDSARAFLKSGDDAVRGWLLLDVRLRAMSGIELQRRLRGRGFSLPIMFIIGGGEVAMAVQVMKSWAVDFVTKQRPNCRTPRRYSIFSFRGINPYGAAAPGPYKTGREKKWNIVGSLVKKSIPRSRSIRGMSEPCRPW